MDIKLPGIPAGHLRLDELFQKTVEMLRSAGDVAAVTTDLLGLDIRELQAEINAEPTLIILNPVMVGHWDERSPDGLFDVPQVAASTANSPAIRARDAEASFEEAISVAAVMVLMQQVLVGRLKILWLNGTTIMSLRPDEFPARSPSARFEPYILYGHQLKDVPDDIPVSSWMCGNAAPYDLDRSIPGVPLFVSEKEWVQTESFIVQSLRALSQASGQSEITGSNVAVPSDTDIISIIHQMRGEGGLGMSMDSCIDALLEKHPSLKRDSLRELDRIAYPNRRRGRKRGQTAKLIRGN
ncbi:hypothetical protein ABENE_23005 [Asticcacaulis benevestitus DSM 16100 = ATCC BAA-896]|uniref:Uncharacterized protein n=1 Tax=Asticcacaulis benevestitus DSM 16100 = ATCC BAA-896 TaxID=1121022 RepID=V4NSF0_9CAUL|nr:hypothetical protein [Asticcacaulis benevestitus]ESQ78881.1 hypothetical protein ABENE_23005 [Asticcacaulis benevestitus DSM 16100 = ATCC BAA-896]